MADLEPMHGENDTEGVIVAKGVSMVVLFCACMICGLVPMFVARRFNWITPDEAGSLKSKNKIVMTLLSFGGGVLLSTTFLHLLPEVDHNIIHLQGEYY
ncbi:jg1512 [Pararge aegeria aegeria]|uniref:Jg1512 protein n=1 Tax=Pararge aegeria aegeria TaxID=348720 RepID=A0A8S4S2U2_9NEOP|nr:jg1512 [Pararge aegeria aegeria]